LDPLSPNKVLYKAWSIKIDLLKTPLRSLDSPRVGE